MKNKGEKKQKATRGRSMEERPTQSRKGVKGQLPLAESRGSASGGVWGNAPTVPRQINSKRKVNRRRRQRSVPASNFAHPQMRPPSCSTHHLRIVAPNGRDHIVDLATIVALFRKQGISRLRARPKGNGNGRSPRSPFGNPRCTLLLVELFHGKGLRNRREKA